MAANDAYTGLEYSNDQRDNKRYPDTNRIRLYKHYLDPRNDNTPPPAYDRTLPDARVPQTPPPPPYVLSVVSAKNQSVKITWVPTPDTQNYSIKRALSETGPFETFAEIPATKQQYVMDHTDTTASSGTKYFYVVTASNPHGESPPSKATTPSAN
ncbi:fibronectin type III domain-containing protein [Geminisphaera colitermitum]|uniref:fibronectin type III domain-containing protein n=1 Tax=Geminisphaera colitermitum TaxID=1148786 RepID=UPI0005B997ED|nr:fibronectin type III domain-containing protein [Geminisphaera colitermitum]